MKYLVLALLLLLGQLPCMASTVCWDGKCLAADTQVTFKTYKLRTKKLCRINGYVVGCAGDCCDIAEFKTWFKDRSQPRPQLTTLSALVIDPQGVCWEYDETCKATKVKGPTAIGSGKDDAMTGLKLGMDAVSAVELACENDLYSSAPIFMMSRTDEKFYRYEYNQKIYLRSSFQRDR